MSDETKEPSPWDMPIRALVLVVIGIGIYLLFGHMKPIKTPDQEAADKAAAEEANTPPPVVHPATLPGPALVHWTAANNNANSMTGDIDISADKLVLRKQTYALTPTHTLQHGELLAVGNYMGTSAPSGSNGFVYKIDIPVKAKLLNGDSMCNKEPTQWVVELTTNDYVQNTETLYLGFFSGSNPPPLTASTLQDPPGSCGNFSYTRNTK